MAVNQLLRFPHKRWVGLRDSNPQQSASQADELTNCSKTNIWKNWGISRIVPYLSIHKVMSILGSLRGFHELFCRLDLNQNRLFNRETMLSIAPQHLSHEKIKFHTDDILKTPYSFQQTSAFQLHSSYPKTNFLHWEYGVLFFAFSFQHSPHNTWHYILSPYKLLHCNPCH